LFPGICKMSID